MSTTKSWLNYRLPKSIRFSPEFLDEVMPIELLGIKGRLHLPGVEWNADDRPYLRAPDLNKLALARLIQHNESHTLWGGINSWSPKDRKFEYFSISNFLMELDLSVDDITYSNYLYGRGHPISNEISDLGKNIDEWFDELCSWIAIVTNQDLNYSHPLHSTKMPGHGLQVWTEEDEVVSLIASRNVIEVNVDKNAHLTALKKDDFIKIVNAMSAGRRPSENHLFLRDARDASKRGLMRKAIIDAGTAVEMTLRQYANSNGIAIRSSPPAMLGWFVHNTAPNLPADTQSKLVDVRNSATHYNTSFDVALIPDGIQIATQIVNSLDPLVI